MFSKQILFQNCFIVLDSLRFWWNFSNNLFTFLSLSLSLSLLLFSIQFLFSHLLLSFSLSSTGCLSSISLSFFLSLSPSLSLSSSIFLLFLKFAEMAGAEKKRQQLEFSALVDAVSKYQVRTYFLNFLALLICSFLCFYCSLPCQLLSFSILLHLFLFPSLSFSH